MTELQTFIAIGCFFFFFFVVIPFLSNRKAKKHEKRMKRKAVEGTRSHWH